MRIAVIIPTQFKRETLIESIASVQTQTRKPDEVIIVNGTNQAAQMNQAIRMSTCDAFVYLSDDDLLEPTFIEVHEINFGRGYEIVCSAFTEFGDRNGTHIINFPCATGLFSKRSWEAVGGFDESIGMAFDWEFAIRLKEQNIAYKQLGEPLWKYRTHPGQGSNDWDAMGESGKRIKAKHPNRPELA
jgi:glycosyltransferase involved in cell wall biosynthesis